MENGEVACLFCGSGKSRKSDYAAISFNGRQFNYRECCSCKLNFNVPLLNADDYASMYAGDYHDEFYFKNTVDYSRQLAILKEQPAIKTILDFGCGDAGLLNLLQKNGYSCTGVEHSPVLVEKLKSQYPDISFHTVESFSSLDQRFDCIHLGDVLEHMTAPRDTMNRLTAKLDEAGYIFLEGPLEHNASLAYYFRRMTAMLISKIKPGRVLYNKPYHTFLANRSNQLAFLESFGLKKVTLEITEQAWPFPATLKQVHSLTGLVQFIVAQVSLLVSSIIPGWGNRICYLGKKAGK